MADNANRNACDRCHTQKLKCKLTDEGSCERCIRLKVECKFSPSRRFRRQHQQRQQQQQQQQVQQQQQQQQPPPQQQHHLPQPPQPQPQPQQQPHAQYTESMHQQQFLQMSQPSQPPPLPHPPPPQPQPQPPQHHQQQAAPSAETMQIRTRSPKRRRTGSDPSLVLPEADAFAEAPMSMVPQNQDGSNVNAAVTPETVFNMNTYDFRFDQVGYLDPNQVGDTQHLSPPGLPSQGGFHQHSHQHRVFGDTWDTSQLALGSLSHPYHLSQPPSLTHSLSSLTIPQHASPLLPQARKSDYVPKPLKGRVPRSRSRQISLRDQSVSFPLQQFGNRDGVPLSWMAQLAEVNSRLMELSSALPAQQDMCALGRPADDRFKVDGFPIDEMFKLTRVVADILDGVTTTGSSSADVAEAAQARLECTDPANSMFFLSIYIRLLDMYQRVFGLVQKELSQAESQAAFRFWKLPDVTVGSFAVDSTPSLQMNLTVQLAEEFLSRLRSATAVLDPSQLDCRESPQQQNGAHHASVFSGVVDGSYQAVRSKEDSLRKHLSELRAEIESLLDP